MGSLAALFFAAFLAATLIPAQSEAVLVALILQDSWPVWVLLALASVGNVMGSVLNWALGRYLSGYRDWRWFPVDGNRFDQAIGWYRRWGRWSLLGSWLPVIGDPLTCVAGVLREPFWRFLLLVSLAKTGRYVVLAAATLALQS